ncbi:DUF6524 family protein [Roseospira goensis]|uniref:Uncharacterized protein n=1 Tax=Roseospira goensis TaxID=391922 RepID=A0A7W6WLH3_9PROT|nr:DUF6524 family protein [Roseospira goensis]MBB4287100.1 hypothetical protein [Roseospira goensis]
MAASSFTFVGFLVRWLVAVVLVLATFNPTDWSLVGWIQTTPLDQDLPLKALLAVVLLIGFIIYLRATMRSIGPVGIGLIVVLFAVLAWAVVTYAGTDWLTGEILIWIGLFAVATIMAVGLSWSHIRRRLTGQYDIDDVET